MVEAERRQYSTVDSGLESDRVEWRIVSVSGF